MELRLSITDSFDCEIERAPAKFDSFSGENEDEAEAEGVIELFLGESEDGGIGVIGLVVGVCDTEPDSTGGSGVTLKSDSCNAGPKLV